MDLWLVCNEWYIFLYVVAGSSLRICLPVQPVPLTQGRFRGEDLVYGEGRMAFPFTEDQG